MHYPKFHLHVCMQKALSVTFGDSSPSGGAKKGA